jgi:hypothetical protein
MEGTIWSGLNPISNNIGVRMVPYPIPRLESTNLQISAKGTTNNNPVSIVIRLLKTR